MGPARAAAEEGRLTASRSSGIKDIAAGVGRPSLFRSERLTEAVRWTFQYNSGRMIALTRAVLASVFLFALWIDPDAPRPEMVGYGILGAYVVVAVALLVLSWHSWWWDYRLAWPVMAGDIAIFLAAVMLTEGGSDFTSPFLAFFAFLMLSATIRWDWRATVATGLAVTALYLLLGLFIASYEPSFDVYRFGRRISYMLVLTLVLAWFGLQRRERAVERFTESPDNPANVGELIAQALHYAAAQSNAARGAIAWADYEEPDVTLRAYGFEVPAQRLGPGDFDPDHGFSGHARLFDSVHKRSLVSLRGPRPVALTGPVEDSFAAFCQQREGIALPLVGVTGRGELLLAGIPGMSADHIGHGKLLAREITAAFDRQAILTLAQDSALAKMRDSLARDLHDTVAQSLAGTALRLEGLRASIRSGRDPEAEIDAIKQSLREEQRHVRTLIARLRLGNQGDEHVELLAIIRPLMNALSLQWGITNRIQTNDADLRVPASLAHELGQVLREAVANAVRHGHAGKVELAIDHRGEDLAMSIIDDGCGFPGGQAGLGPWSIRGRLDKLNGALHVTTGAAGTRLDIAVPAGGSQ